MNHYATLGISPTATREAVKRAFRELTKKLHPDRNPGRVPWATHEMKRVLEAHRVLSNVSLREAYDRRHGFAAATLHRPESRLKHKREGDSLLAQTERILYDLLGGHEARAMENYERIAASPGYDMAQHLDDKDWVDCNFLLAEQYAKRKNFERAMVMYEALYHSEKAKDRHSYFRKEIGERVLRIVAHDVAPNHRPEEAARCYLRALALDLPKPRRAFVHKKLAEAYIEIGDEDSARRHMRIAIELLPDMKGAAKVRRRLGLDANAPAGTPS